MARRLSPSPLRTPSQPGLEHRSTANLAQRIQGALARHPNDPCGLAQSLIDLTPKILDWAGWHAVKQAGAGLPDSLRDFLADQLDGVLMQNLRDGSFIPLDDEAFQRLHETLLRLPSDAQRQTCVGKIAPRIGQYIDQLMNNCCQAPGDGSNIPRARDTLHAWQALLPDTPSCNSLRHTIGDALAHLEALSAPPVAPVKPAIKEAAPQTTPIAERVRSALTQHGDNPLKLIWALYALTENIQTVQDWVALHEASHRFSDSPHDGLANKLLAHLKLGVDAGDPSGDELAHLHGVCQRLPSNQHRDAFVQSLAPALVREIERLLMAYRLFTDATATRALLAVLKAWKDLATNCPPLKGAIQAALREPVLPSGRDLATMGSFHEVDVCPDIWPRVAEQLLPPLNPAEEHGADVTSLSRIAAMASLNRWFRRHLHPYLPMATMFLLDRSTWFSWNISQDQAIPRWTRLPPFQNFLQWTQPAGDADPALTDERRLLLLLQAALLVKGHTNLSVIDHLKPLWNSYCSSTDPAKAERLQLPRLLAQAVLSTPFPKTAELSDRHRSVLDWLRPLLGGLAPSLARPAWVELGIGIKVGVITNRQAQSCFFVVNWTYRFGIFDQAVQALIPWADASFALESIAAVLMATQLDHLHRPYPAASERQVSAALNFMRQFSAAHRLQGSLRTALGILQQQASDGLLTAQQQDLLNDCLRQDPTQPSDKALALR